MIETTSLNRRRFLAWLGGAGLTLASFRGNASKTSRPVLIQVSPLAGFQYHHGEALWDQLREGDSLALTREPENPHDQRAVRLDWHNWKLGYIPRIQNTAVAQMLDRGDTLQARITKLRKVSGAWDRVAFEIRLIV